MPLQYTHRALNGSWPGEPTRTRKPSPFKANWGDTMDILDREIFMLGGRGVVFALNVTDRDIRQDGGVRADARIKDPGVVIEFKVGPDLLSFPCDTFDWWQDNVRAIALALEALRKVDRYGVRKGRQYEGFKQLPGAGASTTTMTVHEAARAIAEAAANGFDADDLIGHVVAARDAVRYAAARTHPDRHGGDTSAFQRVQLAKTVLAAHHGGTL